MMIKSQSSPFFLSVIVIGSKRPLSRSLSISQTMDGFDGFSLYGEGEETASCSTMLGKKPRCEIRKEKWTYLRGWAKQHRKDFKLRKKERKERGEEVIMPKRVRFNPASRLDAVTIFIDCQFEGLMTERVCDSLLLSPSSPSSPSSRPTRSANRRGSRRPNSSTWRTAR